MVTINGVEHNGLVIPKKMMRAIRCEESDGIVVYFVIVPALLTDDQRPLVLLSDDNKDIINISTPGEYINATTDKLQPYAGTRTMISMSADYDDRYSRTMKLRAIHE